MSPTLVLDTREKRCDDFVFSGYGNEKTSPAQGNDYATFERFMYDESLLFVIESAAQFAFSFAHMLIFCVALPDTVTHIGKRRIT